VIKLENQVRARLMGFVYQERLALASQAGGSNPIVISAVLFYNRASDAKIAAANRMSSPRIRVI